MNCIRVAPNSKSRSTNGELTLITNINFFFERRPVPYVGAGVGLRAYGASFFFNVESSDNYQVSP